MKMNFKFLFLSVLTVLFLLSSCKKKKETVEPRETGTMTDVEGNVYNTVKIGDQWWMAENLRVTKYRNGWPIKAVTSNDPDSIWAKKVTGAYCKYYNDDTYSNIYGMLYNYYVVIDTNLIAPAGWHVPTDDDWKRLEMSQGMSQADADKVNWRGINEGDKLKIESPQSWYRYGNVWDTNESGFTALAGSCRLFNGIWGDPGPSKNGFWWSSSSHASDNQAWYRYLDYKVSTVFRYHASKNYGMSIRLVKD